MSDATSAIDTLGQRLTEQARRIVARCVPDYPWTHPVEVVLDHLTTLPDRFNGRFDRREAATAGDGWDVRPRVRHGSAGIAGANATRVADIHVGRPLPSDVAHRLRAATGPGVDAIRVHDDTTANTLAGAHRADAVTVGSDIFFRQGRFRPREPRGFALLVHEATHVLERLRPGASWRRATPGGTSDEEHTARAREAVSLTGPAVVGGPDMAWRFAPASGWAVPNPPPAVPLPQTAGTGRPSLAGSPPLGSSAAHPMAAAQDRQVEPAPPTPVDLEALRASLVHDLMRQLRDEFERGG
jgi:Domain of unknown function (DUF4157)